MKIGILSDTHIPSKAATLPEAVLRAFACAGHIIHAGDIADASVIHELDRLAHVTAVAGNIDPPELQELLGFKKIVTLVGFRFGVVHGHGAKGTTLSRAAEAFYGDAVDCIVFGHSHAPYCRLHESTLFFNPGSPTDSRRNRYFSFGIIEADNVITPHIIFFDNNGNIVKECSP